MVFSFFASVADGLPFRIRCRRASFRLCHVQGAPCLTLAVSKVLFRHPVSGLRTQRFLGFLSLDLDGV